MTSDHVQGIYLGSRGEDFKKLIRSVLKKSKLKKKYIDMLTDEDSMKSYSSAFTSDSVDEDNNYQVMEQLGDLTGNKFIVMYMYKRFPQLKCSEGVKVVARLRINYGSKNSFAEFARKLGFWTFISATNDLRQRKMKSLLEDVFEAFLGTTEDILDTRTGTIGVGNAIVYSILSNIFDEIDISLKYEDLYDSKTRLKELFDLPVNITKLGPLVYKESKSKDDSITYSSVYRVDGGKYQEKPDGTLNKKRIIGGTYTLIGEGSAALKADAQQKSSTAALNILKQQGWSKPIPLVYQKFNKNEDNKEEKIDMDKWGENINDLQSTKEKTKYQNKYLSTPLSFYCRTKNEEGIKCCIERKADPNIEDTDGLFSLDHLLISGVDEKISKQIMIDLFIYNKILKINKQVYDMYFIKMSNQYFKEIIDRIIIIDNKI